MPHTTKKTFEVYPYHTPASLPAPYHTAVPTLSKCVVVNLNDISSFLFSLQHHPPYDHALTAGTAPLHPSLHTHRALEDKAREHELSDLKEFLESPLLTSAGFTREGNNLKISAV
jgi:hypothetical protein